MKSDTQESSEKIGRLFFWRNWFIGNGKSGWSCCFVIRDRCRAARVLQIPIFLAKPTPIIERISLPNCFGSPRSTPRPARRDERSFAFAILKRTKRHRKNFRIKKVKKPQRCEPVSTVHQTQKRTFRRFLRLGESENGKNRKAIYFAFCFLHTSGGRRINRLISDSYNLLFTRVTFL